MNENRQDSFDIRKYQARLLGILKYIDSVCRKYGLRYYLAYGTLIGAVRHKGFIPWDDDADIEMPRDDYDRFVEAMAKENDQRYRMICLQNDPKCALAIGRVVDTQTKIIKEYSITQNQYHVFVDVMPLDGQPENDLVCKAHFMLMSYYKAMADCADHPYIVNYEKHQTAKKILKPLADIRGARYWAEKADRLARKRDYRTSRYVCYGIANRKEGEIGWDAYEKILDVPFEDAVLMIPAGYDQILKSQYGDYMQLPPEDKRVSEHLYQVVDLGE